MRQKYLAANKTFLQPSLAFFCKGTVTGRMAILHNGLGNVKKFFTGNKGLIERNLDLTAHNLSFLFSIKQQSIIKIKKYACFLKLNSSGNKKSAYCNRQKFNIIEQKPRAILA
jgi:hypothetical protein